MWYLHQGVSQGQDCDAAMELLEAAVTRSESMSRSFPDDLAKLAVLHRRWEAIVVQLSLAVWSCGTMVLWWLVGNARCASPRQRVSFGSTSILGSLIPWSLEDDGV